MMLKIMLVKIYILISCGVSIALLADMVFASGLRMNKCPINREFDWC